MLLKVFRLFTHIRPLHFGLIFITSLLFNSVVLAQDIKSEISFPVEKFQLKNGLIVLLQKDNTAPLISINTWFRVGSKDEEKNYTGLAHLFEHMMFKGTKKRKGEEFTKILEENGGDMNAFTSRDYTGYYITLPSSKLELALDMESDRMVNLNISESMLKSEKEVVKEERRLRYDNSILGLFFESIFQNMFTNHPYRWPVIGTMEDVDRADVPTAMAFYKKYYAPNNAVLCVVGDIDIGATKKLINKYYGDLEAQKIEKRNYPMEPPKTEFKKFTVYREAQSDYIADLYLVPAQGTQESYVFEILGRILGSGNSSRLHKRLVYDSQIATSVSTGVFGLKEQDIFSVYFALKPERDLAKKQNMIETAQKIIDSELWTARNKLYSAQELQKAKNNIIKDLVDSLKTFNGRAQALISNEVLFGSYEKLFTDLDRYLRISPEEVKSVAEKYLNLPQRTTLHLEPGQQKP